MLPANRIQLLRFIISYEMSRWIVRVNEKDRARSWADGFSQALKSYLPTVVLNEMKRAELHVLDGREKIKQRIAGMRGHHLVARLAQQPK